MNFEPVPFTPGHPALQKHISYFYFLNTDEGFETRYFAFPHINTVLNIHKHASFDIHGYYTKVYGDAANPYAACVQGIRENPLLAHLQGKLNKVTILFKPLGINHFINGAFGETYTAPSELFNCWDNEPAYTEFLEGFYSVDDAGERASLLEDFLLNMMRPLPDYEVLHEAIKLLGDFEHDISVADISQRLKLNARTFNRIFKKHLGVSPVTYRKVARFRHSLQNKLFETDLKRLTDIAYQSNYYDQASFNKIYRSLTGSNPQKFFNKVKSLADDRLIFEFLEK